MMLGVLGVCITKQIDIKKILVLYFQNYFFCKNFNICNRMPTISSMILYHALNKFLIKCNTANAQYQRVVVWSQSLDTGNGSTHGRWCGDTDTYLR